MESWAQEQRRGNCVASWHLKGAVDQYVISNNRWMGTSSETCVILRILMTNMLSYVMNQMDYRWAKQKSPCVHHLRTRRHFMSNQSCGWKRETTVCHCWISKDGDLAAWLERTNWAEWRYDISWVHRVSRTHCDQHESCTSHSPDKTPTLQKTKKSQAKVAGQKTTACVWKWTWEGEEEEKQEGETF